MASTIKMRSSILFHIGKGDRARVYASIKTNMTYYFTVLIVSSLLVLVFSHWIAKLFFSDAELHGMFRSMLRFYSLFLTFNCSLPGFATLLRIFDMNLHASLIMFLLFGVPFVVQNYVYVVYLRLENFSPVLALGVCNVMVMILSTYFLCKNVEANLEKKIGAFTQSTSKTELLTQPCLKDTLDQKQP